MYVPHPLIFPARANAKLRQQMRGFTMIELMVALLVVAILAAIAVPTYKSYVDKSRLKAALADVVQLSLKMEQYYQKNLNYLAFPAGSNSSAYTEGTVPVDGTVNLSDKQKVFMGNWKGTQSPYFYYWIYTDTVTDGVPANPTFYYVGVFSKGPSAGNPLPANCWIQLKDTGERDASDSCGFSGAQGSKW